MCRCCAAGGCRGRAPVGCATCGGLLSRHTLLVLRWRSALPPSAPVAPSRSCYRDRLLKEPPPDETTQGQLAEALGWLSKALQLLSLLLQHGGQMEAFLDDGGVMSLCLHLSKYPAIHANLPPG